MNPTQFNTSRDWAALARDKAHTSPGQVYIGRGDRDNPLKCIFDGYVNDGDFANIMNGDTSGLNYFVEINRWEKHTGLNHAEVIGEVIAKKAVEEKEPVQVIYTAHTPALNLLVKEILKNKTVLYTDETRVDGFIFYSRTSNLVSDAGLQKKEFNSFGAKEVSMAEFIAVLTALPEAPKIIRFSVSSPCDGESDDEFDVIIEPTGLSIGCHKFTPEEFARIEEAVQQIQTGIKLGFTNRRTIFVDHEGIEADGNHFSFEDFAKINAALKSFK